MFVNNLKERNKENVKKVQKLLNKLEADDFKQKCIECSLNKECKEINKCLR